MLGMLYLKLELGIPFSLLWKIKQNGSLSWSFFGEKVHFLKQYFAAFSYSIQPFVACLCVKNDDQSAEASTVRAKQWVKQKYPYLNQNPACLVATWCCYCLTLSSEDSIIHFFYGTILLFLNIGT